MPVFPTDRTHVGFQASSLPYLLKVASMGLPFSDGNICSVTVYSQGTWSVCRLYQRTSLGQSHARGRSRALASLLYYYRVVASSGHRVHRMLAVAR